MLTAGRVQAAPGPEPVCSYEVVSVYPHSPKAFTQGLAFDHGRLWEGTGLYGQSVLRRLDLASGRSLASRRLPARYFGEGVTVFGGRIYQLTWHAGQGFIYRADTLQPVGHFRYTGEGWGLAHDGRDLILSDGSADLRYLDPQSFKEVRRLTVTAGGKPVERLNELELVGGEIYANVWLTPYIARISPVTGAVTGWIDLSGLPRGVANLPPEAVANGIAYDAAGDRLFVTGKYWPALYQIRLLEPSSPDSAPATR